MNILFLDLDGTIREAKSGEKFITDPYDQKPIDGALEQCEKYHKLGYKLIGITNQGGVAAGHKSLDSAITEQQFTLELFPQIERIYFWPDFEGLICYQVDKEKVYKLGQQGDLASFRKPGHGMIKLVQLRDIPQGEQLMVGDRYEDEEAAANAGIKFMWAQDWRKNHD